jgi:NAD(P)-dependent dehydrogenase (short-subunit alcohol dehydrogenase family)
VIRQSAVCTDAYSVCPAGPHALVGCERGDDELNDFDDLDALVGVIAAHGHGLDVIFANAGVGEFAALHDVTPHGPAWLP